MMWILRSPRPTRGNVVLLSLCISFLQGCHYEWKPEDVVGRYKMTGGEANDMLVLNADNQYVRYFAQPGQPMIIDTGRWDLKKENGKFRVIFQDFVSRWHVNGIDDWPGEGRGIWDTFPQHTLFGSTRLVVLEDLGLYYIREK
jgi:hypothetical protein